MLKQLFNRFKWLILFASGLSVLGAISGMAMLSMITEVIGSLGRAETEARYSFIVFMASIIGVIAFGVLSQYVLLKLSSTVVCELQTTLLQRILATSYEKIEKNGRHRLMAVMEGDVSTLSQGLLLLPSFIYSAVTVVLCLGYMIYSSWQLFLFVAVGIALIVAGARFMLRYALDHQMGLREYMDAYFSNLQALTNGGKEINLNLNRRRHFYAAVMLPLFDEIRRKTVKSSLIFIGLGSYTNALVYFLIGSVVYGAHHFLPGIEIQVVVAFVVIILYMVEPLSNVVGVLSDVNEVRVSLNKIEQLDLAVAEQFSIPLNSDLPPSDSWRKVKVDNVRYRYNAVDRMDGYEFVLGPVSAEFNAGEITFVTGGNGSGKSTFAKLLIGLYTIDSGGIYVDGQLVGTDFSMENYKNSISVIFSDFFVFTQLLNADGQLASDKEVKTQMNRLQLEGKVSIHGGILSSIDLSQGQRKRLALLQSCLEDAHLCVYDEWAADQDPVFKRYFYCELLPELKKRGKIVVIISHDDHYFYLADKVLKFEEGALIGE
jgi:multidrug/microcin transport system ATP-binding/permease protein